MMTEIEQAIALLKAGELVGFPTETVYGLGADAANPDAVAKIFAAKGRPAIHPLIVHLADQKYLEEWAVDIPGQAWILARIFWPGPLTMILRRAPWVPLAVTGGQDTVGVRVPSHPLAIELLTAYAASGGGKGGRSGIAAPSANRFGYVSPTLAQHVRDELGDAVALVLDGGPCMVGIESTIIDLSEGYGQSPRLLRPGHVSLDEISAVLGVSPESPFDTHDGRTTDVPRVSGSLEAHYAPATPLCMVSGDALENTVGIAVANGKRCAVLVSRRQRIAGIAPKDVFALGEMPDDYAHALYATLREVDSMSYDLMIVQQPPESGAWMAINDRLRRAACGAGKTRRGAG